VGEDENDNVTTKEMMTTAAVGGERGERGEVNNRLVVILDGSICHI
jgi:hypothetical protein